MPEEDEQIRSPVLLDFDAYTIAQNLWNCVPTFPFFSHVNLLLSHPVACNKEGLLIFVQVHRIFFFSSQLYLINRVSSFQNRKQSEWQLAIEITPINESEVSL